ncbi:tetratricopeptide repeat protein [Photobacterium atrarenae]|uniref:Tetratricopeptide repeat protein n=1 Tax=Photobacterium atrarenae TaxID=865757 RepID=A0ABY5GLF4_9GAMM|nr:tetratricopeptide repeat protein [Photobacterium atrarenae]UTV30077.1 tetratricopeptide repeat protein [Photobacterium atrarenae]
MAVFPKRPSDTGNQPNSRLHLVSGRTLVILTLTSLWALWLLAPDQSMLIRLITQSTSPQVSLAFLQEIQAREPDNRAVSKLIIENYYQMGELDKAISVSESMIDQDNLSLDWPSLATYVNLLQDKYYQAKATAGAAPDVEARLRQVIHGIDYIPDAKLARDLADTAISLSMTQKGYDFLVPHLQSGRTNRQELVSLAIQNSDYDNSLKLQKEAFNQSESLESATALLNLYLTTGRAAQSREFIGNYQGQLSETPDFLRLTIAHSTQIGNLETALKQSGKLLALIPSTELRVATAELAIATGQLALATTLLTEVTRVDDNPAYVVRLHDLHRWQGNIEQAAQLSQRLLAMGPTEDQIRDGIAEARALGDIYQEGIYFDKLASNNQLSVVEYADWLNAVEKSQGTDVALQSVQNLAARRPKDPELIVHQARLYEYRSDHSKVIEQWEKLQSLRRPSQAEAMRFANAYIMNRQPEQALAVLTAPKNWLQADDDYLESVSTLAWETSNRLISRQVQEQLIARTSGNIDVYRYLRTRDPVKTKEDIDNLVKLYQHSGNAQPLLAAMQASRANQDQPTFAHLVDLATRDSALTDHIGVLLYRAQLAKDNQAQEQAADFYRQVLQQAPYHDGGINGLLWLAIEANDQDAMASLYDRYKRSLQDNAALWLSFATAAQQMGQLEEADLWYQQLLLHNETSGDIDAAVLLNYAALQERQGEYAKARRLHRYLASQLSDELLSLEEGDIAYHSLVALFVGEQAAQQLAEQALIEQPDQGHAEDLFRYYLAAGQPDSLIAWHRHTALSRYTLPDWQQLAIAIQEKDRPTMERLLEQSSNLPEADKNTALQLTGQYAKAWLHGEQQLGQLNDPEAERQLRRVHVAQHPDQTHSVRAQATHHAEWDISRYSLDYYAPHQQGNWRLGTDFQRADTPDQLKGIKMQDETRLRGTYQSRLPDARWSLGFDLADGLGEQRLGFSTSYLRSLNDYWDMSLQLGIQMPIEASQLLFLTGEDNTAGFSVSYQPTPRESLSAQLNWHDISTRYGDDIGQGWDLSLRAAEQLFFNDPAWQIYASYSLQDVSLSNNPLNGINSQHQRPAPLVSGDFIDEEYQRIAIGQHLWHGTPGQPGPTLPSPRYWLDTSVGYNVTTSQPDITVTAALGWQLLGNDELYFSADWQSQDRNGDESLKLSLGYFYSF